MTRSDFFFIDLIFILFYFLNTEYFVNPCEKFVPPYVVKVTGTAQAGPQNIPNRLLSVDTVL